MKKLISVVFLACSCAGILFGDTQDVIVAPVQKADSSEEKLPNSIVGGLFMGISISHQDMTNSMSFDPDLNTYGVKNKEAGKINMNTTGNFGFEGKLGLMKTFNNGGFRVYGYYGTSFGSFDTLGVKLDPNRHDRHVQTAYLDARYYGGIAEFMFGSFQKQGGNLYFLVGGGYQFTDYSLNGSLSLADGDLESFHSAADVYRADNEGKIFGYKSPLISFGVGIIFNQHHMFEIGARYLFKDPSIVTKSPLRYDTTYYTGPIPTEAPKYDTDDVIKIRNNITNNFYFSLNYNFLF